MKYAARSSSGTRIVTIVTAARDGDLARCDRPAQALERMGAVALPVDDVVDDVAGRRRAAEDGERGQRPQHRPFDDERPRKDQRRETNPFFSHCAGRSSRMNFTKASVSRDCHPEPPKDGRRTPRCLPLQIPPPNRVQHAGGPSTAFGGSADSAPTAQSADYNPPVALPRTRADHAFPRHGSCLIARERREVVSIYPELRLADVGRRHADFVGRRALHLEHLDDIGPLAIAAGIGLAAVACYAWAFLKKQTDGRAGRRLRPPAGRAPRQRRRRLHRAPLPPPRRELVRAISSFWPAARGDGVLFSTRASCSRFPSPRSRHGSGSNGAPSTRSSMRRSRPRFVPSSARPSSSSGA